MTPKRMMKATMINQMRIQIIMEMMAKMVLTRMEREKEAKQLTILQIPMKTTAKLIQRTMKKRQTMVPGVTQPTMKILINKMLIQKKKTLTQNLRHTFSKEK